MIDSPKDLAAWVQDILAAADNGLTLGNLRDALWGQLSETVKQSPEVLRYGSDLTRTLSDLRENDKVEHRPGGIWAIRSSPTDRAFDGGLF